MTKQTIQPLTAHKREPLPRTWFMARGYKQADPKHVKGHILWLHPKTNVALFPGIILDGYERMAQFKATHSQYRYERLTKTELLQIFVGPAFVVHTPDTLMDRDLSRHCEA